MARFATGAKSQAVCDRCGFNYPYPELRMEWTGLKTCPECWEPKHPQLEPRVATDVQALFQPRPGTNTREDMTVWVRSLKITSSFQGGTDEIPVTNPGVSGSAITTSLGTVIFNVTINETGFGITTAVGGLGFTTDDTATPAGVNATTALNSVSITILEDAWGAGAWNEGLWGQ